MNTIYNRNIKVLPWTFALMNTPMFFFASMYFYHITKSYTITMVLISLESLIKAFLEIPTGVISDKYLGRKWTEVWASFFKVLGFSCYALGMIYIELLWVGTIFVAIGLSLYSGNTTSLLHDTLKKDLKDQKYHHYYAKFNYYKYITLSLSILICGLSAYYFNIIYVVFFCILQRSIRLIIGLFLKDPEINIRSKASIKTSIEHIFKSLGKIRAKKKLQWLTLLRVMRKSFEASDQLGMNFYKTVLSFFSIAWLLSGAFLIAGFSSLYSEKIARRFGLFKTFLYVRAITVPAQMIAYLFPGTYTPFVIEAGQMLQPIESSAESALLHKDFSDNERATMESIIEIISSIALALTAAFFGWIADVWSLTGALFFATSCKLFIIPLSYKMFKNKG